MRTGNVVNGVVRKHAEPADSQMPKDQWRLYVFQGEEAVKVLHLHRQSSFLFGRDETIADVLLAHPSCSKEHAVVQFRLRDGKVKPYIMDLESTNGTKLNRVALKSARYVQLIDGDVISFGEDAEEYVMKFAAT